MAYPRTDRREAEADTRVEARALYGSNQNHEFVLLSSLDI